MNAKKVEIADIELEWEDNITLLNQNLNAYSDSIQNCTIQS